MRPSSGVAFVAACLAICLSGCLKRPVDDPHAIVVAITSGPSNFDPRVATDDSTQQIQQLIFSDLMDLDADLRVGPALAERLDNPDPTTYVATLRRGVRFHDGHELTSADVVYTFNSFLDPDFVSTRKVAFRGLEKVEARDRYAVVFTLKAPFLSFPTSLVIPVVPDGAGPDFREHPIGTGPYKFVSYAVDDRVELAPFDDYFGGRPPNDGLMLRIVPDELMRGLELQKGTVDVVVNDIGPDIVHQLAASDRLAVTTSPGTDYQYIGLNMPTAPWRMFSPPGAGIAIDRRATEICGEVSRRPHSDCFRPGHGHSHPTSARSSSIRQKRARCSTRPATAIPTATDPSRAST